MFASHKQSSVRPLRQARRLAGKQADKKTGKPVFETLEERQHFSVVTVTTTADSGTGSLRSAIQAVDAGTDNTIHFDIPKSQESSGMWNIDVKSALPKLTKSATVDGWSQPGYTSTPVIELNGMHTSSAVVGLEATGGNTTVRGLSFDNFSIGVEFNEVKGGDVIKSSTFGKHVNGYGLGTAILLNSPNSSATGNVIVMNETTAYGVQAAGNKDTVANSTITGFSNSSGTGVEIEGTELALGGYPSVSSVTVANNTISNVGTGIESDNFASDDTVSYNHITNAGTGIFVANYSEGTTVIDNVVTDCVSAGIDVESSGNTIGKIGAGNTVTGTGSFFTGGDGIQIWNSSNTISGNTSSDNGGSGIALKYAGSATDWIPDDNTLQGNTLKGNYAAAIDLNNASGNLIGGDAAGKGNTIVAPLQGIGEDAFSWGNTIEGNSIAVTDGYYGISGTGLPAAPVITAASAPFIGWATVTGTVHAAAFSTVHVEVFASPTETSIAVPPPLGAEGQTFLGYVNVTTNIFGNATFSDTVARTPGEFITATATTDGATSEFSAPVTETYHPLLVLTPIHLI